MYTAICSRTCGRGVPLPGAPRGADGVLKAVGPRGGGERFTRSSAGSLRTAPRGNGLGGRGLAASGLRSWKARRLIFSPESSWVRK